MVRSRDRSPSPSTSKRIKITHGDSTDRSTADFDAAPPSHFAPEVLDHDVVQRLHSSYLASKPFKYAVIERLFQDELLKAVKDECLSELSFQEKETDIYKVFSDLSSLMVPMISQPIIHR